MCGDSIITAVLFIKVKPGLDTGCKFFLNNVVQWYQLDIPFQEIRKIVDIDIRYIRGAHAGLQGYQQFVGHLRIGINLYLQLHRAVCMFFVINLFPKFKHLVMQLIGGPDCYYVSLPGA